MFRLAVLLRNAAEPVVKVSTQDAIAILTINRPKQLNALNKEVSDTLIQELIKCDQNPALSVMIITGVDRAFVAGADIKSMLKLEGYTDALRHDDLSALRTGLPTIRKPIIAAVNGFVLGGGCELAMACDIIVASEKAKFGQPEVKLGILPGMGGTQRLPRVIGKAKAMEWCLTGWQYTAEEAERAGLVSRVVKHEELMPTALKIATTISQQSQITCRLIKQAINGSQETTLSMGLQYEADLFAATFATKDRKEGMSAFAEKRTPVFKNE
ncbi:enoyl-CoA hydratase [Angomonas deanei]|uniref:Enoyl-CoA hydratase/isomerase, putative n=1 Tax=Angomonas deanei TaxID=59799 RepID=S9WRB0_9TRYP|nr:enoyl-CoA hydratase [Angomonas deanei]EPY41916.1 enoyl-CoA hydratase [Angomonas deanei]EPY43667.1 enoyl-CoA hydratase [Angomonas deanei]CAD2218620.1 Enoyl-CoA hydratase/isomerase, putative [Angomonas deanei]|eukprot:EPY34919.1 enoyl-CoA hydratase [Angomonas deanei]